MAYTTMQNNFIPPTQREKEVLKLVIMGLNNKEISKQLFIASCTAKIHVQSLLKKFNVTNRLQLSIIALKLNVVDISEDEILQICSREVY